MAAEDARDQAEPEGAAADEPGLAAALAYLRALDVPCAPPIGVGEFDILCASARHVIVWYTPAREGHVAGEYAIPTPCLAAAWAALRAGQPLDEAALLRIGGGAGRGRWLLALLAQLPGVRVSAGEPVVVALDGEVFDTDGHNGVFNAEDAEDKEDEEEAGKFTPEHMEGVEGVEGHGGRGASKDAKARPAALQNAERKRKRAAPRRA